MNQYMKMIQKHNLYIFQNNVRELSDRQTYKNILIDSLGHRGWNPLRILIEIERKGLL